tara:strand:- start:74 stop:349 length:276 start_codon:yes stop_codon:yes gene_type:complete
VEEVELVYLTQLQVHLYLTLEVLEAELITQEQQEERLLVELVEQVYLEQVAVLLDQVMMELLTEVVAAEVMVKHLELIVIDQEMVVLVLLF